MYPRVVRVKSGKRYVQYLRLLEKVKKDGRWKEEVVCNLCRLDIEGKERFNRLLRSLAKYSDEELLSAKEIEVRGALEYGALYVIRKIMKDIGLTKWIEESCGTKRIGLGIDGVTAMICNRLMEPRSELGIVEWIKGVYLEEFDKRFREGKPKSIAQRFYYTLDWLIKGKGKIEEKMYIWSQTLFPSDIVFYDITNIQFEGSGCKIGRLGYHKLGKKNHKQVLLGLVMVEGLPVSHHVFRGNRAEKTTLTWIKEKLKKKYNIGKIIIVCDRGMVSTTNLEEIEREDGYIVAIKRRRNEEAKLLIESSDEGYIEIGKNLKAKEIKIKEDNKRRVICINENKAREEKKKREEILQELEGELNELKEKIDSGKIKKENTKIIISSCEKILNKKHGKRYFRYEVSAKGLEYGRNKENIEYEEKIDGRFMIKTTEQDIGLREIVLSYKDLMDVEEAFRDLKDTIEVAPVYHQISSRTQAHIFVCVLALFIARYMEKKLSNEEINLSFQRAISQLKMIKVVINNIRNRYLKYVTVPSQELYKILRTFGIIKLPKMLSDISSGTVDIEKHSGLLPSHITEEIID